MVDYTVALLAEHREQIKPLACLLNAEWGHLEPWRDVAELESLLAGRCQSYSAPFALVALKDGRLLGAASVKFRELVHHQDKLWWIGDVIVAPDQRGKGIGGHLVDVALRHAEAIGITELFLYTPDQEAFYAKRGWQTVGRDFANAESSVVMKMTLRET